jgi:hypothetical protein
VADFDGRPAARRDHVARGQERRGAGRAGFEQREAEGGGAGQTERTGAAQKLGTIDGMFGTLISHGTPCRKKAYERETLLLGGEVMPASGAEGSKK